MDQHVTKLKTQRRHRSDSGEYRMDDSPHILIVDDSSIDVEVLKDILKRGGYKIRSVSRGQIALNTVKDQPPDLILLDVKMPEMDGYEVCRRLKSDKQSQGIPVIFISALDMFEDRIKGFRAGGVDYITKPFHPEEILARIETHLILRGMQKKLELKNCQLQQEIADRRQAEKLLQEKEARYRAIVETFDGYIYICSRDYRVEFMNKQFIERTGYDGTGEKCFKVIHNRDSVCPWCVNDRVFNGETVRWEVQSPKDNLWFYVVNTPLYHADASISKQSMIWDITERKIADEALRKSEEDYRTLVENLNIGVYRNTGGPQGHFVQANSAIAKMFAYDSVDEFMKIKVSD